MSESHNKAVFVYCNHLEFLKGAEEELTMGDISTHWEDYYGNGRTDAFTYLDRYPRSVREGSSKLPPMTYINEIKNVMFPFDNEYSPFATITHSFDDFKMSITHRSEVFYLNCIFACALFPRRQGYAYTPESSPQAREMLKLTQQVMSVMNNDLQSAISVAETFTSIEDRLQALVSYLEDELIKLKLELHAPNFLDCQGWRSLDTDSDYEIEDRRAFAMTPATLHISSSKAIYDYWNDHCKTPDNDHGRPWRETRDEALRNYNSTLAAYAIVNTLHEIILNEMFSPGECVPKDVSLKDRKCDGYSTKKECNKNGACVWRAGHLVQQLTDLYEDGMTAKRQKR